MSIAERIQNGLKYFLVRCLAVLSFFFTVTYLTGIVQIVIALAHYPDVAEHFNNVWVGVACGATLLHIVVTVLLLRLGMLKVTEKWWVKALLVVAVGAVFAWGVFHWVAEDVKCDKKKCRDIPRRSFGQHAEAWFIMLGAWAFIACVACSVIVLVAGLFDHSIYSYPIATGAEIIVFCYLALGAILCSTNKTLSQTGLMAIDVVFSGLTVVVDTTSDYCRKAGRYENSLPAEPV